MRIIITGTPGTGKTTVANALARRLRHQHINEHDFCLQHNIGKADNHGELVVPVPELQKELKKVLEKEKDFILDGHLVCETKIPADLVVVLTCNVSVMEKRLRQKGYSDEKIFDNLFAEETQYCYNKAAANFGSKRVLVVDNSKGIKKTLSIIIKAFEKISSNGGL